MQNKVQLLFATLLVLVLGLLTYTFYVNKKATNQPDLKNLNSVNKTLDTSFGYMLNLDQKYVDELAMTCKNEANMQFRDNLYVKCFTKDKNPYVGLGFKNIKMSDVEIKEALKNRALNYFNVKNLNGYKCSPDNIDKASSSNMTIKSNNIITCNIIIDKSVTIESAYYDADPSKGNSNIIISLATKNEKIPDVTVKLVEDIISNIKNNLVNISKNSDAYNLLGFINIEKAYAGGGGGGGGGGGNGDSGFGAYTEGNTPPMPIQHTCPSGAIVSYSFQCLSCPSPQTVTTREMYSCRTPRTCVFALTEDGCALYYPERYTTPTPTIQTCPTGATLESGLTEYCRAPVQPVVNIQFQ